MDLLLIHLYLVQVASVAWSLVKNPLAYDVPCVKYNVGERKGLCFLLGKAVMVVCVFFDL